MTTPAASVPLALPWITGEPASLFWHVRAVGQRQPRRSGARRRRSTCAGSQRAARRSLDRPAPASSAGAPWTARPATRCGSRTPRRPEDVLDDHQRRRRARVLPRTGQDQSGPVLWRVRAERVALRRSEERPPGRRRTGPWSPVFKSAAPAQAPASPLRLVKAVSDVVSTSGPRRSPTRSSRRFTVNGAPTTPEGLYRVYVVHRPRLREPRLHRLPGLEPGLRAAVERRAGAARGQAADGRRHRGQADRARARRDRPREDRPLGHHRPLLRGRRPGRVMAQAPAGGPQQVTTTQSTTRQARRRRSARPRPSRRRATITYQDTELPQDVCATGRFLTFGKAGRTPTPTSGGHPTATGLSPNGRLLTAVTWKPRFFGSPLVTWDAGVGRRRLPGASGAGATTRGGRQARCARRPRRRRSR